MLLFLFNYFTIYLRFIYEEDIESKLDFSGQNMIFEVKIWSSSQNKIFEVEMWFWGHSAFENNFFLARNYFTKIMISINGQKIKLIIYKKNIQSHQRCSCPKNDFTTLRSLRDHSPARELIIIDQKFFCKLKKFETQKFQNKNFWNKNLQHEKFVFFN